MGRWNGERREEKMLYGRRFWELGEERLVIVENLRVRWSRLEGRIVVVVVVVVKFYFNRIAESTKSL